MKKLNFLGAVLTLALAFGIAFGTQAYNAKSTVVLANHYDAESSCPGCEADVLNPGLECTINDSGVPCTCDFTARNATTEGTGTLPPCVPLYKNAIQP